MPAMQGQTTVPANSDSANVLAGSLFEFITQDSLVMISAVVVTASNGANVQATFNLGGVALLQPPEGAIFAAEADTIPNDLYHNIVRIGAAAGERLFLRFHNQDDTAQDVRWAVRIDAA